MWRNYFFCGTYFAHSSVPLPPFYPSSPIRPQLATIQTPLLQPMPLPLLSILCSLFIPSCSTPFRYTPSFHYPPPLFTIRPLLVYSSFHSSRCWYVDKNSVVSWFIFCSFKHYHAVLTLSTKQSE